MKRAIISPLCSAFIIPGLGQILNHELKKGVILLVLVFLFFIAAIIKMTQMILSLLEGPPTAATDSMMIMEKLRGEDWTALWFILAGFGILWIYSIIDAIFVGVRVDRSKDEDAL
jgi:TM2 domain-containing membrane protein YozV